MVLAAAATACSSGGDTAATSTSGDTDTTAGTATTAAPTTVAPPTSSVPASSDVPAAVLPPTVLGDDAVATTPAVDAAAADAGLLEECPSIARRRARYPVVRRERVLLAPAGAALPTVLDDLTEFADDSAAADVFNASAGNAMLRCLPRLVARGGLELGGVAVVRVPIAEVGDAAAAIRLRGTSVAAGLATPVTVELIVVQRGPFLHLVVATASDLYRLTPSQRRAIVASAGG